MLKDVELFSSQYINFIDSGKEFIITIRAGSKQVYESEPNGLSEICGTLHNRNPTLITTQTQVFAVINKFQKSPTSNAIISNYNDSEFIKNKKFSIFHFPNMYKKFSDRTDPLSHLQFS
jgi:hypothetical protein